MYRPFCLVASVVLAFVCGAVHADQPGEKELFEAIKLRLEAKNRFQLDRAIGHCQKALTLGLSDGDKAFCQKLLVAALLERATTEIRRGLNEKRRTAVLDDLKEAVKIDPAASRAHLLLARLQALSADDRKAAVASATKVIDVEKAQGEQGDVELLVEALQLRADLTDDPKQKAADLEEALKLSPESAGLLLERGQTFLAERKFKEAEADFEAALRIVPKSAELLTLLGEAQMAQDKLDDALKSFTAAVEVKPLPVAYLNRSRIYLHQGKGREAVNDINKVIALGKATSRLLLLRASAHHALKDDDRAVTDADSALKLDSENTEVMLQAGLVFYQAKRNAKALETFNKLLEKDAESAGGYAGRADTYCSSASTARRSRTTSSRSSTIRTIPTCSTTWRGCWPRLRTTSGATAGGPSSWPKRPAS